ncbi:MAG: hypothetical protein IKC46_00740 [Lachnospiraceae bacterium]|nr:hypothetical protein [Lachnospiraceae bacterium]
MANTNYQKMYEKIYKTLGELTPLKADCGLLCDGACCKGDEKTGMRLFPHEESSLRTILTEDGVRLAVCDGTCDRSKRPLACRIFPFFPTIDEEGEIFVEEDTRAANVCPMIGHSDEILFDRKFLKAVKKVGEILAEDEACRAFLEQVTEEIDMYREFHGV